MPASSQKKSSKIEFRGSLVRTVVTWLLILSLLPVVIISAVNYFRMRGMLKDQVTTQLQVVVENYTDDYEDYATRRRETMHDLLTRNEIKTDLLELVRQSEASASHDKMMEDVRVRLREELETPSEELFSGILLLDRNGEVIVSTRPELEFYSFRYNGLSSIIGETRSIVLYNPAPVLNNDLALFTSEKFVDDESGLTYTLVGVSQSLYPQTLIEQAQKFFAGSTAYIFGREDAIIGLNEDGGLALYPNNQEQISVLRGVINSTGLKNTISYVSQGDVPVLSYARWIPVLNIGFVVEVPEATVYEQTRFMGIFLLMVMLGGILITGFLLSFGMRQIVTPLTQLAESVQRFAQGDWTHRARIGRDDEIGLLAYTFNSMADELGKLYRSLETKVEERNQQLRAAAEVAQVVTSTTERKEMLRQSVDLLCERFDLDFAGIYLLDNAGAFFTERETGGRLREQDQREGMMARIRAQSIYGKAIASNQLQVVLAPTLANVDRPENLLPGTQSGVVIPITIGEQVLGLLETQSRERNTFPPETVAVLKLLANQLANGLQNVRLIENAQVDLLETALLYQTSRRVAQARSFDEVTQVLKEALSRTSYLGVFLDKVDSSYLLTAIVDPGTNNLESNLPRVSLTDQRVTAQLAGHSYLIIENLSQPGDLFALTAVLSMRGCRSAAVLPIYGSGGLTSLMVLGSRADAPMNAAGIEPYVNLADVVANTLERLRVVATLEQNLSELQTMASISQAISAETNLESLFSSLSEQILEVYAGNVDLTVALYDPARDQIAIPFTTRGNTDLAGSAVELDEELVSAVVRSRKPLLLGRNSANGAESLGGIPSASTPLSWLGVPLLLSGSVIGAMILRDHEKESRFAESDLRFFNTLALQVAVAIRNAQLLDETQQALKAYDQEHFLLNNLLDNIPGVVAFKDRTGRYLRVSRMAAEVRGYDTPSQMEGRRDTELQQEEVSEMGHQVEQDLMSSGQRQQDVIEHRTGRSGSERWWLSSRLPMKDADENVVGMLSISQDITDLKQTEQLAQRRASQLRTTSEIARDASGTLNVDELLNKSVNLIRDRFGFYHASIFLNDPLNEYAILRESTGEAGDQMKKAGHRLAIGSQSLVGSCSGRGEALVVNDISLDANYYSNPLLPETRSEACIPLKTGERVIGVIDVQSSETAAFQPDDVQILQILADQIAVAIVNADLYVETQENLAKHRFLHQISTAAAGASSLQEALSATVNGLRTAMSSDQVAVYLPNQQGSLDIQAAAGGEQSVSGAAPVGPGEGLVGLVALGRQPILVRDILSEPRYQQNGREMRSALAVPILYSDSSAGVLLVESTRTAAFNENDQEILASLGSNLGAILANAQLVAQVRQQMEQQKMLFDITSKIRRSGDIKTILETSARELAKALKASKAQIEVTTGRQPSTLETFWDGSGKPEKEIGR